MDNEKAISLGILAINTLMHPDATRDEDFEYLEANAEEAVRVLVDLRTREIHPQGWNEALEPTRCEACGAPILTDKERCGRCGHLAGEAWGEF